MKLLVTFKCLTLQFIFAIACNYCVFCSDSGSYTLAPKSNILSNLPPSLYDLMVKEQIEYYLAVNQKINPHHQALKGIYGFAGPDIASLLLSTNATEAVLIDSNDYDLNRCSELISSWLFIDQMGFDKEDEQIGVDILKSRKEFGYWGNSVVAVIHPLRLFLIELKKLEVDPKSIAIDLDSSQITFEWAHPSDPRGKQKRTISFINRNLNSETEAVAEKLKDENYDFYFMKGMYDFSPDQTKSILNHLLKQKALSPQARLMLGTRVFLAKPDRTLPIKDEIEAMQNALEASFPHHQFSDINQKDLAERVRGKLNYNLYYGWWLMMYLYHMPLSSSAEEHLAAQTAA